MDAVKEDLQATLDSITPEFLSAWDLNSMMRDTVVPKAPVLQSILHHAAQTDRAVAKNKIKDCSTACNTLKVQRYSEARTKLLTVSINVSAILETTTRESAGAHEARECAKRGNARAYMRKQERVRVVNGYRCGSFLVVWRLSAVMQSRSATE
ncbi:uncharacterized protein F5147DRAFT_651822 [Suillus discolor]|uniref:Uncharacterized protein n=1 Tax=Suillus discolor TaxID=1912936 RepID=A0A9P7JVH3_9AGAM|nr:uncharacterized protein F5147DRAFT_651822 [Suillus discolor]KAG2110647.1 hypothetical protein F5147DRAFT_651822 [Suillus discolor]